MGLVPRLLEHRQEVVSGLRSGDPVASIDDEERDAVRTELLRLAGIVADLLTERPGIERRAGLVAVQAELLGEVEQRLATEDRATFAEVRLVDPPPRFAVQPLGGGIGQQLVGRPGVAGRVVQHVVRMQALIPGQVLDPAGHRFDLLGSRCGVAHAELAGEHLANRRHLADRRGRIELERVVDDLDLVTVGESGQRGVEPVESEAAPRADDVGPDLDLHSGHQTSVGSCRCNYTTPWPSARASTRTVSQTLADPFIQRDSTRGGDQWTRFATKPWTPCRRRRGPDLRDVSADHRARRHRNVDGIGGEPHLADGVDHPICPTATGPSDCLLRLAIPDIPHDVRPGGTGLLQVFYSSQSPDESDMPCDVVLEGWAPFSDAHCMRIVAAGPGKASTAGSPHPGRRVVGGKPPPSSHRKARSSAISASMCVRRH